VSSRGDVRRRRGGRTKYLHLHFPSLVTPGEQTIGARLETPIGVFDWRLVARGKEDLGWFEEVIFGIGRGIFFRIGRL